MKDEVKKLHQIRYIRLQQLVDAMFQGKQRGLAEAINKTASYVSFLLNSPDLPHHKNLGEDLARHIERSCNLPIGWLDSENDSPIESFSKAQFIENLASNKPGRVNADIHYAEAVGSNVCLIQEREDLLPYICRFPILKAWQLTETDKGLLFHVCDTDDMGSTMMRGDLVVINSNQSSLPVDGDGVYAFLRTVNGFKSILFRRFRGLLASARLSADGTNDSQELSYEELSGLNVIGRVILKMTPVY